MSKTCQRPVPSESSNFWGAFWFEMIAKANFLHAQQLLRQILAAASMFQNCHNYRLLHMQLHFKAISYINVHGLLRSMIAWHVVLSKSDLAVELPASNSYVLQMLHDDRMFRLIKCIQQEVKAVRTQWHSQTLTAALPDHASYELTRD